jgi:hypothetical protein
MAMASSMIEKPRARFLAAFPLIKNTSRDANKGKPINKTVNIKIRIT